MAKENDLYARGPRLSNFKPAPHARPGNSIRSVEDKLAIPNQQRNLVATGAVLDGAPVALPEDDQRGVGETLGAQAEHHGVAGGVKANERAIRNALQRAVDGLCQLHGRSEDQEIASDAETWMVLWARTMNSAQRLVHLGISMHSHILPQVLSAASAHCSDAPPPFLHAAGSGHAPEMTSEVGQRYRPHVVAEIKRNARPRSVEVAARVHRGGA
eukprot:6144733-Pyramimonas_sp.AAC.1